LPYSRREFLQQLGVVTTGVALGPVRWLRLERPHTILLDGHIVTMDPARPRAQAVAVAGERLLAVGTNAEVRALASRATRVVDLGGRTVVPGFVDAHSHPAGAGLSHLTSVDCDLRSIAAIRDALRARAARTPPGEWVLGFKYDDTKTREGRFLTRADLDAAVPDHPVLVRHRGGHTAFVNGRALAAARVAADAPDPPGGRFERDASGGLTGRVLERATDVFDRVIPDRTTAEDRRKAVALISQMLAKAGITSVTDAYGSVADVRAYQDARDAGELGTRVYCMIGYFDVDKLIEAGLRTGFGDAWVRLGGMKATCDGSISERTARVSEPYVGRPGDHGIWVTTPDELWPLVRKAHVAGWQVGIHANGDEAIDAVLGLYERAQREHPRRDPRFRLEHCTVVTPALVRRIAALGAIPTPFSTYVYFHGEKMREYGAARLERMFALRSFLDAGVRATLASDYPPGPFEPMMALQSAVTRTDMKGTVWGPSQRVSVDEALRAFTQNGAYASFEERDKGTLEEGKLADLVVLGRDPYREDPSTLVTIPIERTMVGGRFVHGG
jgi:predicted amidohydrolase YtcJ